MPAGAEPGVMIVTETAGRYRFVTQPDHATLSGRLAARWSDRAFVRPDPWHALCIAADHHDQGWTSYDMTPRIEAGEAGEPDGIVDFVSVPAESWVEFYADGVTAVAAVDRYAGLLASMHAAGLRRSAYGTRPGIPDRSTDERFTGFIDEQETFQRRIAAELADSERYGAYVGESELDFLDALHESGNAEKAAGSIETSSRLYEGYLLLQTFDTLSLYLCRSVSLERTDIGPVPTGKGEPTTIDVLPVGPGAVRIEPYPFDSAPLSMSVGARVVPVADAEDDLERIYYEAEHRQVEFTLHR